MNSFADKVAKLCLQKYNSLKKTGKPTSNEWTVLSGIVLENINGTLSVVSLTTGTKCLGGSDLLNTEIWERGSRLSDSHAEILARRAFLRYLYDQLDLLLNDQKSDVFALDSTDKIGIKPGILFHFFSTQTPCGDCSIFPKEAKVLDEEINPPAKIRKISALSEASNDSSLITTKKNCRIISDIYRTGAKCVSTEERQDLLEPGINYHVLGSLRTKPGRGDPTLSLSCSDKLAKWNILGVQGSFLSLLIAPLRLESITIGGGSPFSQEAMERGLYKRFGNDVARLKIFQATESFIHLKGTLRTQPCPTSIIWCSVRNR
ncbi:tRNA-specific adenosine deaminase 1 isoform X2 [Cephus cinctus]|nr:tRNA-specific adenosine deaminase 1 isoform X2 [Cephus cinctus]